MFVLYQLIPLEVYQVLAGTANISPLFLCKENARHAHRALVSRNLKHKRVMCTHVSAITRPLVGKG